MTNISNPLNKDLESQLRIVLFVTFLEDLIIDLEYPIKIQSKSLTSI